MMDDDLEFDRPGHELGDDEYPEYPDEEDLDDETSETLPCPECGAEVYEDAPRCPACGAYITPGSRSRSGPHAWWIVLGLVAAILAVLAFVLAQRF